jgi:hypothetical protein
MSLNESTVPCLLAHAGEGHLGRGRALVASRSSAARTGLEVDWLTNALIVSTAILIVKMSLDHRNSGWQDRTSTSNRRCA